MNVSEPPAGTTPGFDVENVTVRYDLSSGRIIAYLPPCKDDTGEDVAATIFEMSPAEAVELAGGITAAAVSAAQHLLQQRTSSWSTTTPVQPGTFGLCVQPQGSSRDSYLCSLDAGHDGDHIAIISHPAGNERELARWSR